MDRIRLQKMGTWGNCVAFFATSAMPHRTRERRELAIGRTKTIRGKACACSEKARKVSDDVESIGGSGSRKKENVMDKRWPEKLSSNTWIMEETNKRLPSAISGHCVLSRGRYIFPSLQSWLLTQRIAG